MTATDRDAGDLTTALAARVRSADRAGLAQAVTLIESSRPVDRPVARALVDDLLRDTGGSVRVGVTGPPGVGKSTFIETLGLRLVEAGHRVAVLAVDPSSTRTRGSILGDRTRMGRLAAHPAAFVRPTPSAGTLGGAARGTREAILIMEAAGYDVVIVETVGVGQSEFVVAGMVDTLLLLTLARTGDALQGMKRGILEMADVIAVNKADGPLEPESVRAAQELASALRLVRGPAGPVGWRPPVLTCSGRDGTGVAQVWDQVTAHREHLVATGELASRRREQLVDWTGSLVRDQLLARLERPEVQSTVEQVLRAVRSGELGPVPAADAILRAVEAPPARPS